MTTRVPSLFGLRLIHNFNGKSEDTKTNSVEKGQLLQQKKSRERIFSLEEVSVHDHAKDCWVVIYDRVYDITDFLEEHPAGGDILLDYAGRDATMPFRESGHSSLALGALETFRVGQLPMRECIYRKPGGYKIKGLPE